MSQKRWLRFRTSGTDEMPQRGSELFEISDWFWDLPRTKDALIARDVGELFLLIQHYTKVTQTQIATACNLTQPKISKLEGKVTDIKYMSGYEDIADGLRMPDAARIRFGLAPRAKWHLLPTGSILVSDAPGSVDEQEGGDPVRRRDFVGLAGASAMGAMLPSGAFASADPFASVLLGHAPVGAAQVDAPSNVAALAKAVSRARLDYQACRYSKVTRTLPGLLGRLADASATTEGDEQLLVYGLAADAYHVAAGLLLKLDDQGLAYLAADRSMTAARASEDPLMVGASARIITHTLMRGGHLTAATTTARSYAAKLDHDVAGHTPDSLSVYGSILLRGAIAAAEDDNRTAALELLDEADEAGRRLGVDGNLRGTAFGPTNARQHRVNICVTLGDAGTAVDVARSINLNTIKVTERKASLLLDTARAYLLWGKHDKAFQAIRTAEQVAREEVADRPAVHRLVRELAASAPPSIKRDAEEFAQRIGAVRD